MDLGARLRARGLILDALADHEMTLIELEAATKLKFVGLVPALGDLVDRGVVAVLRDHPEPTMYALAVER